MEGLTLPQKRKECFKIEENGENVYFHDYDYVETSRLHVASLPLLQRDSFQTASNSASVAYVQEQYKHKRNNFEREADVDIDNNIKSDKKKIFESSSRSSSVEKCKLALSELSQLICLTSELKSTQNIYLIGKHDDSNISKRSVNQLSIHQLIQLKKNNYKACNSIISDSLSHLSKKNKSKNVYTQFTVELMKKWNVIVRKRIHDGLSTSSDSDDNVIRIDCSYDNQNIQRVLKSDQMQSKSYSSPASIATFCIQPITSTSITSSTVPSTITTATTTATNGYQLELTKAEKRYQLNSLKFSLLHIPAEFIANESMSSPSSSEIDNTPSYLELASATSWEIHCQSTRPVQTNINTTSINSSTNDSYPPTFNSTTITTTTTTNISTENMSYIDDHLRKRHHDSFSRLCFQKLKSILLLEAAADVMRSKLSSSSSSFASSSSATQVKKDDDGFTNKIIWKTSSGLFNIHTQPPQHQQQQEQQQIQQIENFIQSLLLSGSSNDSWISNSSGSGCNIEVVEYDDYNFSIQLTKHVIFRMSLVPLNKWTTITSTTEMHIVDPTAVTRATNVEGITMKVDDGENDNVIHNNYQNNSRSAQIVSHILKQALLECEHSVLNSLSTNISTDMPPSSSSSSSSLSSSSSSSSSSPVLSNTLSVITSAITRLQLKHAIKHITGLFHPFHSLIYNAQYNSNNKNIQEDGQKHTNDDDDDDDDDDKVMKLYTFFDGVSLIINYPRNTFGSSESSSVASAKLITDNKSDSFPIHFPNTAQLSKYMMTQSLSTLLRWFGVQLELQQQSAAESHSITSSLSSHSPPYHHHRHHLLFIHQSIATCLYIQTVGNNNNSKNSNSNKTSGTNGNETIVFTSSINNNNATNIGDHRNSSATTAIVGMDMMTNVSMYPLLATIHIRINSSSGSSSSNINKSNTNEQSNSEVVVMLANKPKSDQLIVDDTIESIIITLRFENHNNSTINNSSIAYEKCQKYFYANVTDMSDGDDEWQLLIENKNVEIKCNFETRSVDITIFTQVNNVSGDNKLMPMICMAAAKRLYRAINWM